MYLCPTNARFILYLRVNSQFLHMLSGDVDGEVSKLRSHPFGITT